MYMSVPRDDAAYLHQVSVIMPGAGDLIVGYSCPNPDPMPVFYDQLEPALRRAFDEHAALVLDYDLQAAGTLRVWVGTIIEKENLNVVIDQLLVALHGSR